MKTKGLFVALMALMICFVTGEAYAYDIAVKNADGVTIYYNYINEETEVEVTYKTTSYNSYSGSVVIPEEVTFMNMTRKVTSIGGSAFYGCSGLTSVTIPNSVTSIGERAFRCCRSLTSVNIPESVTSIGKGAFSECSGLTSVTIGNSVTSIGNYAFSYCTSLTSVTIPNSVTSIGERAFECCSGLTSLSVESGNTVYDSRDNCNAIIKTSTNELIAGCQNTIIPNSVRSIGGYAFSDCSGLTSVTIPESVTSIGNYAFSYCSSLTSVTILNSVTSIGKWAFSYCTSLTSVTIPNSVTSIGERAFGGCSGLTSLSVESGNTVYDSRDNCNAIIKTSSNELIAGCQNTIIPNSVTSIGNEAFWGCSGLTSVNIPESVTSIGKGAFYSCSGLTSVTIGSGIKTIDGYAFADCSVLSDVYCYAKSVPTTDTYAFNNTHISAATLHVPASAIDSYSATAPWSGFGTKVAFARCATPEISVVGGQLTFTCETEGVKFVPTATFQNVQGSSDEQANDKMVLAGTIICRVSVYATKEGYEDSEVATKDVELNVGAKGDVNGDGAVSPADAIESLYIFFGVDQSSAPKKAEPQ